MEVTKEVGSHLVRKLCAGLGWVTRTRTYREMGGAKRGAGDGVGN
jgi:hypothetical protein